MAVVNSFNKDSVDPVSLKAAQNPLCSAKSPVSSAPNSPDFRNAPESPSMNLRDTAQQHKYKLVEGFVESHGGTRVIQRVLVANNGIAAVKEIRSVRKWAYETFGNDRVVEFIAMATPDDFGANAEYIKMADSVAHVPGGTNNNNYANVQLIVNLAQELGVQVSKPSSVCS